MNTTLLLWLVLTVSGIYTCFTGAANRGGEQHHDTGFSLRFNRARRDVGMTSRPSSHPTVRPHYTFRRRTTRPAGQTWVPLTATVNNNLTEKEISNRQNKTKWNFSRFPTANRFYSTLPYNRATGSPVLQLNNTDKLASNHHYNGSTMPTTDGRGALASTTDKKLGCCNRVTPRPTSPTDEQSSRLSLLERYTIVIAVLSAVLFLTLLGFLAHCNRVRKKRKVISITLA